MVKAFLPWIMERGVQILRTGHVVVFAVESVVAVFRPPSIESAIAKLQG
jgi:hypothetical protein